MKIVCSAFLAILISGCIGNSSRTAEKENCWSHISNAIELREAEKYDDSLQEIEKHGSCDTSEIRMSYFYHKGWTYYEMGEYQKAIDSFSSGLETQPTFIYAYWRRGLSHEALGDTGSAEKDYRRGYELGMKAHGEKFLELMDENPKVKEKLVRDWSA